MKKPSKPHKPKKGPTHKTPPMMPSETAMKDMACDRNFTKNGTPKLSASSGGKGEGAMGQRR